jgi:serine/threonine protein kinase
MVYNLLFAGLSTKQKFRMAVAVGTTIGNRYLILRDIGEGGFAWVYLVRDIELDRLVALKILKTNCQFSDHDMSRFQREARLLAQVEHPNIVSVFAFGITDESQPYIVMEYLEGQPLSRYLGHHDTLSPEFESHVWFQICSGLAHAHSLGLVHRDITPANIFLVGEPPALTVKLIDFGLSKMIAESAEKFTESGLLIGTPDYMSPEMCGGQPVDLRSDIYSLGCVMYQALSGKKPFFADSPIGVIHLHLNQYPLEPSFGLQDPVRERQLKQIILRCLQKDPTLRFQSCEELSRALCSKAEATDSAIAGRKVQSLHPWSGPSGKSTKAAYANWLALWIALLAVVLASVFCFYPNSSPPKESLIQIGGNIDRALHERRLSEASELLERTLSSHSFLGSERSQRIAWLDKYFHSLSGPETGALRLKLANVLFFELMEEVVEDLKPDDELWLLRVKTTATYLIEHESSPARWNRIFWVINHGRGFDGRRRYFIPKSKDAMVLHELRAVARLHTTNAAPDGQNLILAAEDYLGAAEIARKEGLDFEYQRYMKATEQVCSSQKIYPEQRLHTTRAEEYLSKNQLDRAEAELVIARGLLNDRDFWCPTYYIRRTENAEKQLEFLRRQAKQRRAVNKQ